MSLILRFFFNTGENKLSPDGFWSSVRSQTAKFRWEKPFFYFKSFHFLFFFQKINVFVISEYIIWDLTYKNFWHFETKRFLMISQIFSKIISFFVFFCSSFIKHLLIVSFKLSSGFKYPMVLGIIWLGEEKERREEKRREDLNSEDT